MVNWYDAPVGGNLLESDNSTLTIDTAGTYYAEAVPTLANCPSDTRTPVTLVFNPLPIVTDETILFCENTDVILEANIANVSYLWSTGETTANIIVSEPGTYTVSVTDSNGCSSTKTITLNQIDLPVIGEILSNEYDITVATSNMGSFEFSLDGFNYQDEPVFRNIPGGSYTVYVEMNLIAVLLLNNTCILLAQNFLPPMVMGIMIPSKLEGSNHTPTMKYLFLIVMANCWNKLLIPRFAGMGCLIIDRSLRLTIGIPSKLMMP
jgi:hypothetical protein